MDTTDAVGVSSMGEPPFRGGKRGPATAQWMAGPREQCGRTEPGLELERGHAVRLGQRAGVGVGQRDDVAEDLV